MEKITITLQEDTVRWLRVRAAESSRSVSRWLADLLEEMKRREDEYDTAMKDLLAKKPQKFKWTDGRKPTRKELHDRASFR